MEVSTNKRSETETKHVSLPDLNHLGKAHDETKTSPKRRVPLFDLNQISVSTYIYFTFVKRLEEDKESKHVFTLELIYREKKSKKQRQWTIIIKRRRKLKKVVHVRE